jgi:hypothetical protein
MDEIDDRGAKLVELCEHAFSVLDVLATRCCSVRRSLRILTPMRLSGQFVGQMLCRSALGFVVLLEALDVFVVPQER